MNERVQTTPRFKDLRGFYAFSMETWRSVSQRWLVPILLIGGPILWTQYQLEPENTGALQAASAMIGATLFFAPLGWRLLFPLGTRLLHHPLRLVIYAAGGAIVVTTIVLGPIDSTGAWYLVRTADPGLLFVLGIFWVGGYALGREIELEQGLDRERQRAEALEQAAERAQLLAVRSHLDPHFLFNTLNAIAEWCREDPLVAEAALVRLSDMLRTVLSAIRSDTWTLQRELELVEALFSLYRIRDPERFVLEPHGWEAAGDLAVPPLLVLSLAENAIKHGPAAGFEGAVQISLTPGPETVVVRIENPGPFDGPRPGGAGLDLARRRLALAWGGVLELGSNETRTWVEIPIPRVVPEDFGACK